MKAHKKILCMYVYCICIYVCVYVLSMCISFIHLLWFQPIYSKEVEEHRAAFCRLYREAIIGLAMQKADHMLIAIIWCPTGVIGIDFLITFLSKFERNLEIREKWSKDPVMLDSPSFFGGMRAYFSTSKNFYSATKALAVSYK